MTPSKQFEKVFYLWGPVLANYAAEIPVVEPRPYPVWLFCASALIAIVGGIANLHLTKKADEAITVREVSTYTLNMGTLGGSSAMISYAMFFPRDHLELLILGTIGAMSLLGLPLISFATDRGKAAIERLLGK